MATPLLREAAPVIRKPRRTAGSSRRRRRRNLLIAGLLVVLAAAAVAGGLLLSRQGKTDERVAVPPVRNLTVQAATKLITDNDLTVQTIAVRNSAKAGTVLSSDPQVGVKVAKKTLVKLTYSNGPGLQRIPTDLAGMEPDAAVAALRDLGFSTTTADVQAPTVPVGRVAGTQPAGGATADPQAVTIVVQVANNQTTVPPLIGLSQDVAVSQLAAADLQVEVVTTPTTLASGQVLLQSQPGGDPVTRRDTITITVSLQVTPTPTPTPTPSKTPSKGPTKPPTSPTGSPTPSTTPRGGPTPPRTTVTPVR
jgi:eukaryotic-like serine/threonine-protein kinase